MKLLFINYNLFLICQSRT